MSSYKIDSDRIPTRYAASTDECTSMLIELKKNGKKKKTDNKNYNSFGGLFLVSVNKPNAEKK